MKIKISTFTLSGKRVFNKSGEEIIEFPVTDDICKEDSVLYPRLRQEYKKGQCKGIPNEEQGDKINGHHVIWYSWGMLCLNQGCEKRVCASTVVGKPPSIRSSPSVFPQFLIPLEPEILKARKNKEGMLRVMTRIAMPPGPITLYKILYQAGDQGLSFDELAMQMRWLNKRSLGKVMGDWSIGKRIDGTDDFKALKPGYKLFLDEAEVKGQYYYRICQELREIIDILPELKEEMTYSVNEIHAKSSRYPDKSSSGLKIKKVL